MQSLKWFSGDMELVLRFVGREQSLINIYYYFFKTNWAVPG